MSGNRPSGGGGGDGSRYVPDAPSLPGAAPDAVQDLLNGVFGGLDSVAAGIGDVVSGLAQGIGDAIGGASGTLVANVVDVAGVLL